MAGPAGVEHVEIDRGLKELQGLEARPPAGALKNSLAKVVAPKGCGVARTRPALP